MNCPVDGLANFNFFKGMPVSAHPDQQAAG
jgi:hypothetical protein